MDKSCNNRGPLFCAQIETKSWHGTVCAHIQIVHVSSYGCSLSIWLCFRLLMTSVLETTNHVLDTSNSDETTTAHVPETPNSDAGTVPTTEAEDHPTTNHVPQTTIQANKNKRKRKNCLSYSTKRQVGRRLRGVRSRAG